MYIINYNNAPSSILNLFIEGKNVSLLSNVLYSVPESYT